jgi:hypothetical protein
LGETEIKISVIIIIIIIIIIVSNYAGISDCSSGKPLPMLAGIGIRRNQFLDRFSGFKLNPLNL